jgi:ferredoxin
VIQAAVSTATDSFFLRKNYMQFIDSTNFERLLKKLSGEGDLFVPVKEEDTGKLHIERVEGFPLPEGMSLEGYRTVETLKGFAQLLRQTVAEYPAEELDELEAGENVPSFIVVGARACDVAAMELVDKVQVEGEFEDPFYRIRRDKMFTIAADCTDCGDSCFCTKVGRKPWPEKGYDLAVARVDAGYLVEAGSERGEKVISENGDLFTAPRDGQEKARDDVRAKVVAKLEENNRDFPEASKMTEPLREALTDGLWDEESARCVECGACTNICPTCYCFLLYDVAEGEKFRRVMSWDSCQVTGYARMAGMGNPRPRLSDRVKHRYYHKYDYLPISHGEIYCTGCGRCIDTCSAGIDMRAVFKSVTSKAAK